MWGITLLTCLCGLCGQIGVRGGRRRRDRGARGVLRGRRDRPAQVGRRDASVSPFRARRSGRGRYGRRRGSRGRGGRRRARDVRRARGRARTRRGRARGPVAPERPKAHAAADHIRFFPVCIAFGLRSRPPSAGEIGLRRRTRPPGTDTDSHGGRFRTIQSRAVRTAIADPPSRSSSSTVVATGRRRTSRRMTADRARPRPLLSGAGSHGRTLAPSLGNGVTAPASASAVICRGLESYERAAEPGSAAGRSPGGRGHAQVADDRAVIPAGRHRVHDRGAARSPTR